MTIEKVLKQAGVVHNHINHWIAKAIKIVINIHTVYFLYDTYGI